MQKLCLSAIIAFFTCSAFAQSVDLRRKIEVSATAETEVTPDMIYVSISLQEYMDGKNKIPIDQLENALLSAVQQAGLAREDFTINNIAAYKNIYQKKKNPDFLAGKQYSIKFHDLNKFNQVVAALDPKGILSTNIDSYDYSKIVEKRRELKIQALVAAKEKASYLLNSLGEKLGSPLSIVEVESSGDPVTQYRSGLSNFNTLLPFASSDKQDEINFKKIKLSFRFNVVFEIVKE